MIIIAKVDRYNVQEIQKQRLRPPNRRHHKHTRKRDGRTQIRNRVINWCMIIISVRIA